MRTGYVLTMGLAGVLLFGCGTGHHKPKYPGDRERPKLEVRDVMHEQPPLEPNDPGRTAKSLIDWASASTANEREAVLKAIQEVSRTEPVVQALCEEAFAAQLKDHSRALIALALVGETKTEAAEGCLTRFVRLPFPMNGHVVEGEIVEQTALATLQAKAVDGLAYRMTASADAEVLRLIREHPSRIVRAEAISAYLWNRGDSAQAKAALAGVVRADERIFLDRVRRVTGDTAATFNPKLEEFLRLHPDLRPPQPERATDQGGASIPTDCDLRPAKQKAPARGRKEN